MIEQCQQVKNLNSNPTMSSSKLKRSSSRRSTKINIPINRTAVRTLLLRHYEITQKKAAVSELDSEIQSLREKARDIMRIRQRQLAVYPRIAHLRNLAQREEALLEEERKVIDKRKEALLNACDLIKSCIAYNKISNKKVIDAIDSYHADRHHLQTFDRKLKLRQHKMCRQLLHIFPFRRVRNASQSDQSQLRMFQH